MENKYGLITWRIHSCHCRIKYFVALKVKNRKFFFNHPEMGGGYPAA